MYLSVTTTVVLYFVNTRYLYLEIPVKDKIKLSSLKLAIKIQIKLGTKQKPNNFQLYT